LDALLTAVSIGSMQMIQSSAVPRPARGPMVLGTIVGATLLAGGLGLAWLSFVTPLVRGLAPSAVRPGLEELITGAAIWGVMLVAPATFAIVGIVRLARVFGTVRQASSISALGRVRGAVADDYLAASNVMLPEGRLIQNLIVGPHGVAVLAELPPPSLTRRTDTVWEIRRGDGRWIPLENPLERAARDAERVRSWIASEEQDFVVKVYAALLTTDPSLARIPACAVIVAEQIPAWLASLPPQRSLNETRRSELTELIRSIA
jgi:hypothetical protein